MKRLLLLLVVVAFSTAVAREFLIERAINVRLSSGQTVTNGQKLNEKAEIVIGDGGKLMFVDQQTKNRWLVQKKFMGRINKLTEKKKCNLVKQSLAYIKSLFYDEESEKRETGAACFGGDDIFVGLGIIDEWEVDSTNCSIVLTPDSITYYMVE